MTRVAVLVGIGVVVSAGLAVTTPAQVGPVGMAAALAVALLCLASATIVVTAGSLAVGTRGRAHRESLAEIAAPRHPRTRGRVRARAPGMIAAA
jgi:hypothetical protein